MAGRQRKIKRNRCFSIETAIESRYLVYRNYLVSVKAYKLEHGITNGITSEGNREIRDRMYALGFKECLREHSGKLIPTYRHTNNQIIHQLDHLYVSDRLYSAMQKCTVGDQPTIFENSV